MSCEPLIRTVVVSCIAFALACNGGVEQSEQRAPTQATEVELLITDPNLPPEEVLLLIDFVSYRISCPASGLTPYDDSIDLAGNFEVDVNATPPVWEMVTNLPLSPSAPPGTGCAISLWVFYEDEVVCLGDEVIPIVDEGDPGAPNEVSIVLECTLSYDPPSAPVGVDGSFDFINGNYCPKMNWLGAVPMVVEATVPPETWIDASAFDVDSTCGQNCDPQLCDFTQNPPVCTPGPNPGFSIAFSAPAGKGSFNPPDLFGTPMTGGTPIEGQTTYTCDPLYPGPTEICAMASDGDNDCDKMRCITIICPDLCEGVVCDDGNECTGEYCNPLDGQCVSNVAPDGLACADCSATCAGGTCSGPDWVGAVSGTSMSFVGTLQQFATTLVNPYTGQSISVSSNFNVNTSSYEGVSLNDTLFGTNQGDFLLAQDPIGTQRICGVENVLTQNNFDAMVLADEFIVFGDMVLEGGNAGDIIWANVGNDTIRGGNGIDLINGGPGDDFIEGGLGNDVITLYQGGGFDSIDAGVGVTDTIEILGIQSQVTITPAVDLSYEFDLHFLGAPIAQIRLAELLVMDDASIDLTMCTGSPADVCNLCGNDALNGGEGCDDGNNVDGDGCSSTCVMEF